MKDKIDKPTTRTKFKMIDKPTRTVDLKEEIEVSVDKENIALD